MTKVVFPSFASEEFKGYEIRQLVSALELRFQALEVAGQSLFDTETGSELDNRYSLVGHLHSESEITDLQNYLLNINGESIFDLSDVTGTPSNGQILQWSTSSNAFLPVSQSSASFTLNDLTNVTVPAPNDDDVLTFDTGSGQWVAAAAGGVGLTTLFDLTDTELSTQGQYDLLFNTDGTNWENTAGLISWIPASTQLRIANDYSINWFDGAGISTELLTFEEQGTAGVPMDYYTFETFTNSDNTAQTYADTTNGLNQTQAGMVNGDEYFIFVRAQMYNNASSAADSNGFRVLVDGTELTGSEQLYEGIASTSTVVHWGNPYSYVGWFTANTAGAVVKTQHKRGSQGTTHQVTSETALILNLTTDVPNHVKSTSVNAYDLSEVTWVSTDAAVVLGAGDWLIYMSGQIDSFSGANTPAMGINDGTTDIMLCGRGVEDSATDKMVMAGAYYLDNYAGGTVTVIGKTNTTVNGGWTSRQAIIAIPLSDFSEAYGVQSTSAAESNLAAQSTPEVISTITIPSIAGTGTNFVALGFASTEWNGTQFNTGFELLENVNGGGDTLIGWFDEAVNRKITNTFSWEGNNHVSSARSYTAGDAVDIKLNAQNFNTGFATQGHRYHGAVLLSLQTADTNEDVFIVGDPLDVTRIDGSRIDIEGDTNLNTGKSLTIWDSTDTDNAVFSHDGTDFNTDFTTTAEWNIDGADILMPNDQLIIGSATSNSMIQLNANAAGQAGFFPLSMESTGAYIDFNNSGTLSRIAASGNGIGFTGGGHVFSSNAANRIPLSAKGFAAQSVNLQQWQDSSNIILAEVAEDGAFSLFDSTGVDSAEFSHDGTDFNTSFANTTDWNVLTGANVRVADRMTIYGGSLVDNDGDLALGIKTDSGIKTGIFVTDNFAFTSTGASYSSVTSVPATAHLAGYYALQTGAYNVNPQSSAGWGFYSQAETDAGTDSKGAISGRIDTKFIANTAANNIAFNAHNYMQDAGGSTTSLTTFKGYRSFVQFAVATCDLTNQYDFVADGIVATANGTITNRRGVYIAFDGTSTTNPYGIYQEAADVPNYFAGNVGIGALPTADALHVDGDTTVTGDFTVSGTLTSINTSDLNIADNIIILNNDEVGVPSQDAGIEIERGTSTNVSVLWNETSDTWTLTNDGITWYDIITTLDIPSGGLADGTVTDSSLRWSGAAWVEETQVRVSAAGALTVLDSGLTDSAAFSHGGTNFSTTFTNTSAWNISGASALQLLGMNLDVRDGSSLFIRDTGDTDFAEFSHDGTDFNTAFTATADWNITGANIEFGTGVQTNFFDEVGVKTEYFSGYQVGVESSTLWHRASTFFRWYLNTAPDAGASDSMQLSAAELDLVLLHDNATGAEVALDLNYTVNKLTSGDDTGFRINKIDTASPGTSLLADWQVGGVTKFSWSDNPAFTMYDNSGVDSVAFNHDGTDFNTDFTNTTDWNITDVIPYIRPLASFGASELKLGGDSGTADTIASRIVLQRTNYDPTGEHFALNFYRGAGTNDAFMSMSVNGGAGLVEHWKFDTDGSFILYDPTATDSAAFKHDGTDFNTDFTNTGDWNLTGLTRLKVFTAGRISGFSSDNTASFDLYQNGTGTQILPAGTANSFNFTGYTTIRLRDGVAFRIEDAGDTDWAEFNHDGTDFNTAFTNTADWNITGLTGRILQDAETLAYVSEISGSIIGDLTNNSSGSATLNTTVDSTIELLQMQRTNGAHSFVLHVIVSDGAFSIGKTYIVSTNYDETGTGVWKALLPTSDAGAYSGNDFKLEINVTNTQATIRAVRVSGATTGTISWEVWAGDDANAVIYNAVSATSTSAVTAQFNPFKIANPEGTDYGQFSHNGTDVTVLGVNSNDFEFTGFTGAVDLLDGMLLRVRDSTNADNVTFSHDGTDFNIDAVNTNDINFNVGANVSFFDSINITGGDMTWWSSDLSKITTFGMGNDGIFDFFNISNVVAFEFESDIRIADGSALRVMDTSNTDWAEFSHDGTDFNTAFTTTADWNISGLTAIDIEGGAALRIWDGTDTDRVIMWHDGTNFNHTYVTTAWVDFSGATQLQVSGGMDLLVRDGATLSILDAGDTDAAAFSHTGTNFVTALTNTTDWLVTGLVGGELNVDGSLTVQENLTVSGTLTSINTADLNVADNIIILNSDEAGVPSLDAGIEVERGTSANVQFLWDESEDTWRVSDPLRIWNSSAGTDYIEISHDGTDGNVTMVNTTDLNFSGVTGFYQFAEDIRISAGGMQVAGVVKTDGLDEVKAFVDVSAGTARFGGFNWTGSAWQPVELHGAAIAINSQGGMDIRFQSSAADRLTFDDTNVDILNGIDLRIRDAGALSIWDSTDSDNATFSHDGVDFNVAMTTTTDVNFTGIAGSYNFDKDILITTNADKVWGKDSGAVNRAMIGISATNFLELGDPNLSGIQFADGAVHGVSGNLMFTDTDSWLRLNNVSDFTSGVYTPGLMRADGGFQVDGPTIFNVSATGAMTTNQLVTINNSVIVNHSAPRVMIRDSDATVDEGNWIVSGASDLFRLQLATDAAPTTAAATALTVERAGTVVGAISATGSTFDVVPSAVTTEGFRFGATGDVTYIRPRNVTGTGWDSGADLHFDRSQDRWTINTGFATIGDTHFFSGNNVNIWDSGNTARGFFSHDGTDLNIDFAGTTDWNVNDGVVLKIWDGGNTDNAAFSHDGADFNIAMTATADVNFTGATNYKFDDSIFITEKAAANADVTTSGQFWVRNDDPNTPMFTDGEGAESVLNDVSSAQFLFAMKPSSETVNNSATLQDDDDLSLSLEAGESYVFEGYFRINTGSNTPDFKFSFSVTQTLQNSVFTYRSYKGAPDVLDKSETGALPSTYNVDVDIADNANIVLTGTLKANATTGGTITLQWAQNTATSANTDLLIGSWIRLMKVV